MFAQRRSWRPVTLIALGASAIAVAATVGAIAGAAAATVVGIMSPAAYGVRRLFDA